MAADLILYALEDTPAVRDAITRLAEVDLIGETGPDGDLDKEFTVMSSEEWDATRAAAGLDSPRSPQIEVGPLSLLKASLDGDADRYLPGPIQGIIEVLEGEPLHEITPMLTTQIMVAMNRPDHSTYRDWKRGATRREVKRFLTENTGRLLHAEVE